jgi:hypothetical protein
MSCLTRRLRISPLAATAGIALVTGNPASAQTVGIAAALRNNVQLAADSASKPHPVILKERVGLGNIILSGAGSMAQLLLLDQTSFTIGANARVRIDRFIYDPNRSASEVSASVITGAFRFMSGKSLHANPGRSSIHSPIASIGIRGTIVDGVIGEEAYKIAKREAGISVPSALVNDTATLVLLRGPGKRAQGGELPGRINVLADGVSVDLDEPGWAVFIPGPGQPPIGPFRLSDKGAQAIGTMLSNPVNYFPAIPWGNDPATNLQFEGLGGLRGAVTKDGTAPLNSGR